MKRPFIVTALALFISLGSSARAADSAARPIADLSWLVGGVWTAKAAALPGGIDRIEVRYNWAATANYIQFATRFVGTDGSTKGSYAGNFYFDPAKDRLAMWYMDEKNEITQGPVDVDGNRIVMTFSEAGQNSSATSSVNFRVEVTKSAADAYHWALSRKNDDAWKPLFSLDYLHSG
jgi:hypothetical protein